MIFWGQTLLLLKALQHLTLSNTLEVFCPSVLAGLLLL